MFEVFMLFGFGLAAFSQLLPAERKNSQISIVMSAEPTKTAKHMRCDPPAPPDRTPRSGTMLINRHRPAGGETFRYGQEH